MTIRASATAAGGTARRSRVAFVGLGVVALGGALLSTSPAGAAAPPAPAAAAPCPDAVPIDDVTAGEPVTGLTVSAGTTPDEFTGEIVGRLANGIAPGMDMIIAKLSGSVITDPGTGEVDRGIWAGMSGSPVYDADGDLIGAVSYSLAWAPSDYAGITPAEDMYAILAQDAPARRPATRTAISGAVAKRMDADRDVSARQLDGGFRQLPMKVSVAGGVSTKKAREIAREGGLDARRFVAAPGGAAVTAEVIAIEAGGNLAGTASYGDVTLSGIGTATAVCADSVIGFGHPFLFSGVSDLTLHGADALYIQRDDAGGSFKVADPAAPVGAITQDRMAGILGRTGALPPTTVLTSTMTSPTASRTGTTNISSENDLGYASALHTYLNLQRVLDAETGGTTGLDVRIRLEGEDGRTLRYHRNDVTASRWSAAEEPVYGLWSDLDRILYNRFEDVTITDIDIDGSTSDQLRELSIGKVERRAGGDWRVLRKGSSVRAEAGSTLRLRVTLNPTRESLAARQTVRVDLTVPRKAKGHGAAYLTGNGRSVGGGAGAPVTDLESMLRSMAARPGNDEVSASVTFRRPSASSRDAATASAPVTGFFYFDVRVPR